MRVKSPGRCDSSRPGDSVAYIRKSYPYVPPWIWNSRINHHKLSVTKNRQNQQNSEVSPMFFCFPYYFTWASSVQDSCCFHVGSPFSAIVWFSLRSISLFFADREWNHRIQRPGDGGMCGKRRHISIGYNRYSQCHGPQAFSRPAGPEGLRSNASHKTAIGADSRTTEALQRH